MSKLAAWLTKITPRVLEELEKGNKSRAFNEYKLQENVDNSIKHLFSLDMPQTELHNYVSSMCVYGLYCISNKMWYISSYCLHEHIPVLYICC